MCSVLYYDVTFIVIVAINIFVMIALYALCCIVYRVVHIRIADLANRGDLYPPYHRGSTAPRTVTTRMRHAAPQFRSRSPGMRRGYRL